MSAVRKELLAREWAEEVERGGIRVKRPDALLDTWAKSDRWADRVQAREYSLLYGTILSDLSGLGFKQEDERLVRMVRGRSLYIEFLTEDADLRGSGRQIDGITASLCPGIDRALQKRAGLK